MAGEIATAYVTIMPKMGSDFSKQIEENFGEPMQEQEGKASRLGGVARGAAMAAGAAFAAAGTAVVGIGKASLEAYSDFEQLEGGMQTLFGDDAAAVMENAAAAFETTGLSANQYMEQATTMAASLVNSLGGDTAAAAALTDQAIQDMSDNASIFGTDMETIQQAYSGFARGQFQMLDSLSLGYSGTQAGMEQLLADAEAISGVHYDIDSYADIVQAIGVVQDEMGIAGNAAEEASQTISGSMGMLGGAWANLVTGLADDNADIGSLVDGVVTSMLAVVQNVAPVIGQIATSIGQAIPQLASAIIPVLPQVLTPILTAAVDVLGGILEFLPDIIGTVMELLNAVIEALMAALPTLLPVAIEAVLGICDTLIENLPTLIGAALTLFLGVVTGVLQAMPEIIAMMPVLVQSAIDAILENLPIIIGAGVTLFVALIQNLPEIIAGIVAAIPDIVVGIKNAFLENKDKIVQAGEDLIEGLKNGITNAKDAVVEKIKGICSECLDAIREFFGIHSPSRVMAEMGGYIGQGLANGISGSERAVSSAIDGLESAAMRDMRGLTASMSMTAGYAGASAGGGIGSVNVYVNQASDIRSIDQLVSMVNRAKVMGGAY